MAEWRYLRARRAAHAIDDSSTELRYAKAFCGIQPGLGGYWFGTGRQEEYETVKQFPKCRRCLARMADQHG